MEKWYASMAKEWGNWKLFDAAMQLSDEEIASLPKGTPIIGMRWVHTDKNRRLRVPGTATATLPVLAKSRLVVQGCQEDSRNIRGDSPTASLFGFMLVCCVSAMEHFSIGSADATCAYLQGEGIDRLLVLRAPRPPPPGIPEGALFRTKAAIYGTKDAGRPWWMRLKK